MSLMRLLSCLPVESNTKINFSTFEFLNCQIFCIETLEHLEQKPGHFESEKYFLTVGVYSLSLIFAKDTDKNKNTLWEKLEATFAGFR